MRNEAMRGETMRDILRHPIAMLQTVRLVTLHLILNAVLLVAASFWLLIPEEHVWQLLFAGLSALLIVFVFLWLHSGTLAYALDPDPTKFRSALSVKIGRMAWLLLGLFVLFWCMRTVNGWEDSRWQIAGYLYSKAPTWLRPVSGENSYVTAMEYVIAALFWYFLPSVLLPPTVAKVAGLGPRTALRAYRSWRYWLSMALTAALGVGVTSQILGWIPGKTLRAQTVSLVIRLIVAYGIATAAWLATAGLLGCFLRPRDDDAPANVVGKAAA